MGPAMQARNVPGFLLIVTFACEALIACAGQMDAMEIVFKKDARDYGSKLARSANAVKVAIKVCTRDQLFTEFFISGIKVSCTSGRQNLVRETFYRIQPDKSNHQQRIERLGRWDIFNIF